MSKRAAKQISAYPVHKTGGKAPRRKMKNRGKRAKHTGRTASGANGAAASPVYKALEEAAKQSVRAKRTWTLYQGPEDQVDNEISGFFRTEEGKDHSCVFGEEEDADILVEMKTAMEALKVPKERCFWIYEEGEILSQYNPIPIKSWNQADGLKKSVARLAWLMQNEEE